MQYFRSVVLDIMRSWLGKNVADGSHKAIVDIYNSIKPLPLGYKVKYTDAWCATTVSAAFHQAGYDAIFPIECGCERLITKAKSMGIWVENDAYVPKPGDCILYDWGDSGIGDCTGWADHIGIVEKVEGATMTIIEGNFSKSVKRRGIAVNGKFIRGFVVPKFDADAPKQTAAKAETVKQSAKTVKATASAKQGPDKTIVGTYKVTASELNVRDNASTSSKILTSLANGTKVRCYGYHTDEWYYVQFTKDGVTYTGFAHSKYLTKV